MTDFLAKIIPLRSSEPGRRPDPETLRVGEIAVNTADGLFFTKHSDGSLMVVGNALAEGEAFVKEAPIDGVMRGRLDAQWQPFDLTHLDNVAGPSVYETWTASGSATTAPGLGEVEYTGSWDLFFNPAGSHAARTGPVLARLMHQSAAFTV